ncbi:MAG: tetratricopeptide repeat protein [Synergistota bacterium]|nr:tetratricopeptide repeat protein [Synergistota bacterium]
MSENRDWLDELSETIGETPSFLRDVRRFGALLRDLLPGESNRARVNVLKVALEEKVPLFLKRAWVEGEDSEKSIDRISRNLENSTGLTPEMVRWSVLVWGVAIGWLAKSSVELGTISVKSSPNSSTNLEGHLVRDEKAKCVSSDGDNVAEQEYVATKKAVEKDHLNKSHDSPRKTCEVDKHLQSNENNTVKRSRKVEKRDTVAHSREATRKVLKEEDAIVQANIGAMYETGSGAVQDDLKAFEWYLKSAEQGYAVAQCALGRMYENGKGVSKDDDRAVKWYYKAAEQGDSNAQCRLGMMYENGRGGISRDYAQAARWYRKAAEQGDSEGQYYLGIMYEKGRGILDQYQAAQWYARSAKKGHSEALSRLSRLADKRAGKAANLLCEVLWGAVTVEGRRYRRRAEILCRKMAKAGDPEAQFRLGIIFESGQSQNPGFVNKITSFLSNADHMGKAVKWYLEAAKKGHIRAQNNLGNMYRRGRGVPQDDHKAVEWYSKAAEQGLDSAQYNLGFMYANGRGVPKDEDKAKTWYRKAADQGDMDAQYNLRLMRENTGGTPKSDCKIAF